MDRREVFVIGATGYIGGVVAEFLQRAGHRITGLARSDEAAARLRAAGMGVHRGDLREPEGLVSAASAHDVTIHVAEIRDADAMAVDALAVRAILSALWTGNKLFIYTSGAGVYGDTGEQTVDEAGPLRVGTSMPPETEAWLRQRRTIEDEVLSAPSGARTVVIRPAMVYGRSGNLAFQLLIHIARSEQGAVHVGLGQNRFSSVHVEDLADLYVRVVERAPHGERFNAASAESVPVRDIAQAINRGLGLPAEPRSWSFEEATRLLGPGTAFKLASDMRVSADRAREVLAWSPSRPGLIEDLSTGSYVAVRS